MPSPTNTEHVAFISVFLYKHNDYPHHPFHIPCPALEQHNYLCTNTGDLMREQISNGIAVSHPRLHFLLCKDNSFSCRLHRSRRYQVGTEYFKTDTGVRSPRWDRNGRAALNWDQLILAEQCKGNSVSMNSCAQAKRKPYSEGFGGILTTCIHWPSSEGEFFSISQIFTFSRRQKSNSKMQYCACTGQQQISHPWGKLRPHNYQSFSNKHSAFWLFWFLVLVCGGF